MAAQVSTEPTRPSLASSGPVLAEPDLRVRGTPWFSAQAKYAGLSKGRGSGFGISVFKPVQTVCGEKAGRPTSSHRSHLPITDGGSLGELGARSPWRSTPEAHWGCSVGFVGPCLGAGVRGSLGSPTSQGLSAHHREDTAVRCNRPERHRPPRKALKNQDTRKEK